MLLITTQATITTRLPIKNRATSSKINSRITTLIKISSTITPTIS